MALELSYGVRFISKVALNDLVDLGFIPTSVEERDIVGNVTNRPYDSYAPYYPLDDSAYVIRHNNENDYKGNWVRTDIYYAPDLGEGTGKREYFLHPPISFKDIANYRFRESAGYPQYPSGNEHKGVDWANKDAKGEGIIPVRSVDYGKVVRSEYRSDSGNWVQIIHDDNTVTDYMHMADGTVTVSVDDFVAPGTFIGCVGSTGNSTGDHLHFQRRSVRDFGPAISPYKHLIMFYDINEQIESNWSIAQQGSNTYSLNDLLLL